MKQFLAARLLPLTIGLGAGAALWGPRWATLSLLALNLAIVAYINGRPR